MSDDKDQEQLLKLIAFSDQAVLLDAKWSMRNGHTVILQLPESDAGGNPMCVYSPGTRFHMVLVEVDDDEQPIDQKLKKKLEAELARDKKGGKLARDCGILCNDHDFHLYLKSIDRLRRSWDKKTRATMSRNYVLEMCKIKSRRELDHDPTAAAAYQNLIVEPFHEYTKLMYAKT